MKKIPPKRQAQCYVREPKTGEDTQGKAWLGLSKSKWSEEHILVGVLPAVGYQSQVDRRWHSHGEAPQRGVSEPKHRKENVHVGETVT